MCVWELKETNVVRVYFPAWINVEYLRNDTWCLELVYSRLSLISQMWQKKKRLCNLTFKYIFLFEIYQPFYTLKRLPGLSQKAAGAWCDDTPEVNIFKHWNPSAPLASCFYSILFICSVLKMCCNNSIVVLSGASGFLMPPPRPIQSTASHSWGTTVHSFG